MKNIMLLLGLFALAGCNGDAADTPALGTLEADRIEVVADSSEPLIAIHVAEGDTVEQGDLLIEQDPVRPHAQLATARANLAASTAALAKAQEGPRSEEIRRARANLAAAEAAVETARLEFRREQALVDQKYASQNRVDVLKGRYEEVVARRDEAVAALEELLAGTRDEEIEIARSNMEAASARVDDIALTLKRTSIESPVSGTVEALPFEVGERPQPGQTVVTLLAGTGVYARVHVPEPLRTRLQPGSPAIIRIDGRDEQYEGRLRWIARDASFTPFFALTQHDRSRLSYLAEVDLTTSRAGDLLVGIPVQVYFPDLQTDER